MSDKYAENTEGAASKRRPQKKITPQRLKNIGLYYLQRFETSKAGLRSVLLRRIDAYARENPGWNKEEACKAAEDIISEFERLHYIDDGRYAEMKVRDYLSAGKPARYIAGKLKAKGISETDINSVMEQQEYDQRAMAFKFARRKKIGPYRVEEERREFRQKDMAALVRAGFDYDVVCEVLDSEPGDEIN